MKKNRKNIYFVTHLLILASFNSKAQEELRPLNGNINLFYQDLKLNNSQNEIANKKNAASINLPFKDDFYYAATGNFPDQNLWSDSSTHVNTGHGTAPPSVGVATFDGLNKMGYPYTPYILNTALTYPADTLTSKPINLLTSGAQTLQASDSVGLSFYYQARGFGDSPEIIDSLILDFYNPTAGVWNNNIWHSKGNANANINDTVFKRGFVMLDSAYYFKDGFKFRFRNKATTSGDFDEWHLDYVYLNKGRTIIGDTTYNDISFGYVPSPLLKRYATMPWHQYKPEERANNLNVFIRSNSGITIPNMSYRYAMYQNGLAIDNYDGGAIPNFKRFKYFGWSTDNQHRFPAFTYTFNTFSDSVDFTLKHYLFTDGISADFCPENDTVIQRQTFKNYYAYDDGSAEAAYYINGAFGKMAVKFNLNFSDTLRSVRIYFDPIGNMQSAESASFQLQVYADLGGFPGPLLLQDSSMKVIYLKAGVNVTPDYTLTTPLILPPGEYYIGFKQKISTGIGVGFDRNLNHSNYLFFDSGSGWTQSTIPGSIMIHPVFGRVIPPPVGLSENKNVINLFRVFPNPSHDIIYITQNNKTLIQYELFDITGKLILKNSFFGNQVAVNVSQIESGVYFLQINDEQNSQHQKIIIQH
ncbi:MAG: T9SS type A sorting domain-containing protein [Sphingobacteriaceae bacterium]|nr:T9SS type A sorting domain-containing protein [Sphingobacteriaceae bacterium]